MYFLEPKSIQKVKLLEIAVIHLKKQYQMQNTILLITMVTIVMTVGLDWIGKTLNDSMIKMMSKTEMDIDYILVQ